MHRPLRPLYLDSAATTRVAPEVCAAMMRQLDGTEGFANPSSGQHIPGQDAAAVIERARTAVAHELRCASDEVIFTSGATESINLALQGIALANARHGRHIITTKVEHKATLACCDALASEGFEVSLIPPGTDGRVAPEAIDAAIRPDTLLISVMYVNNETGAIQPIPDIAAVAARHGVLLHVDAAQAAGKLPVDVQALRIDLLSVSAHKFHGPKGVGCLFVRDRPRVALRPLAYGGGQELGLRPGTLATHQIVGLATALALAAEHRARDLDEVSRLRTQFIDALRARLPIRIHGDLECTSPYIVNLSVAGVRGDALINQCAAELAIASGSACSSGTVEPSHVLRAMGVKGDALYGAVRVSFDRYNTAEEITRAAATIVSAVQRINQLGA